MSSERNYFYPYPYDNPPPHRAYIYTQQLTDFLGVHESSESILGNLFRCHTLLLPFLTMTTILYFPLFYFRPGRSVKYIDL